MFKNGVVLFIRPMLLGAISLNAQKIIHDAEQAILQDQFGEQWAKQ